VAAVPDDCFETVPDRGEVIFLLGGPDFAVPRDWHAVHHPGIAAVANVLQQVLGEAVLQTQFCAFLLAQLRVAVEREDIIQADVHLVIGQCLGLIGEAPEAPVVLHHGLVAGIQQ